MAQFDQEIMIAERQMKVFSKLVQTEKWQGVATDASMATYEIKHYLFKAPMMGEGLEYYRDAIKPNVPWADDHFEERVCGQPINPGIQWKKWPYAHSADRFREKMPKEIDERDWAYLAGMIDGDGAITFHKRNSPESTYRPRISISQKDHDFIHHLGKRFPFGNTHYRERKTTTPNGTEYDSNPAIWFMTRKSEVKWVLERIIPFLVLKKERAIEALNLINSKEPHHADGEFRFLEEARFNHNYMERYWPKLAGGATSPRMGIRHPYGDLLDVVKQLAREPHTRQAILPVFGFEDTGAVHGGRVPCSLFYQFFLRDGELDISYTIRSCDMVRHFRDDIYLTVRLLLWVLQECRKLNPVFNDIRPGTFVMLITSLHMFVNDAHRKWGGPIGDQVGRK